MSTPFHFNPLQIPAELAPFRQTVRDFLNEASQQWSGWKIGHSWTGFDSEFSREVGQRGWIGMTWPKQYGGHERSALERYVMVEEMLAVGAPLGAHWFGDRQSGPLILRLGTEQQRQRFLPAITRGEASFCIGLSEPDSGSDLASIRSRADKVDGGWRLNGRKIWTTNGHLCDFMIGLFRSGGDDVDKKIKHQGLSQFIIDMKSSGIEARPIADLTGEAHFNEVLFDDVFVPDEMIIGQAGNGWQQATSELTFERSQPDRFMSCFPLLPLTIDALDQPSDRLAARQIGQSVADLVVLREMSLSVLGQLDQGNTPSQEAALVKELGNSYEQRTPNMVRELLDCPASLQAGDRLSELQSYLTQTVPSFSLRGGTREILRGIIAKGLGLK